MDINIGIIGYGYMGKTHSYGYTALPYYYDLGKNKVNLHALVSSSKTHDSISSFKKIYKDYRELLADPDVNAVHICLPNFMHKEVIIEALKSNKHIYCEKPLTLDLKEAEEVVNVLKISDKSLIHRVAFEYRFAPAIIRAKQIIEEGHIGKIINFNFKYYGCEFLNPNRPISWQSDKNKSGGGVVFALGVHAIDLINYLVGDITNVCAEMITHFKERPIKEGGYVPVLTEDIVNSQLKVNDSIPGTLSLSQVAAGSNIDLQFEIYGEDGSIKFDHDNPNVLKYFSTKTEDTPFGGFKGFTEIETYQKYSPPAVFPPPRVNISWSRYHIASQFDFINSIINGKLSEPNIMDGYKAQKVVNGIFESAKKEGWVKI